MKKLKVIVLLVVVGLGTLTLSFREDLFQVSKNLDIFASLYKEININYVEETNPSDLMRNSIDAMLGGLDPYTEYIPESEIEDYKLKYVSTQYGGIGAGTLFIDGKLFVNEVSEGNPAHKQDIKPGDQILKINEVEIKGKDRSEISQLLRGPKGSSLTMVLLRDDKEIKKSLVREEIKQPNVSYSGMLDDQIGYIKLDKFLENSGNEVKDALVGILKDNPKGIVLDLRNNGGGILQEAVKIVNLFVEKGVLVVVQKGRNPEKTISYQTQNQPLAASVPVVVLINGTSASASEIVAGALQDLDRAVVIGQRSYGKGLVQQTFNLPYNSLVKVTVAKYFTPSGRCIQAMDYAHKNEDGQSVKFADSLMKPFNTKGGRTVYNGNGIYPDIFVEPATYSPITLSIVNKNLFFDYANAYKKAHPTLQNTKTFQLNDNDYTQFVSSLAGKDYSYVGNTEKVLTELKAEAEKENKLESLKEELQNLSAKLVNAKKNDLNNHKQEIKRVLETQIVGRYAFEKGKIEHSFQYDQEIAKAKGLFDNQAQINSILEGKANFKIIGTPKK
jgi:carboxyl-terminal processing protease